MNAYFKEIKRIICLIYAFLLALLRFFSELETYIYIIELLSKLGKRKTSLSKYLIECKTFSDL